MKAHPDPTISTTESGPLGSPDVPPEGMEPPPLSPQDKKLVKNLTGLYALVGAGLALVKPLAGAIVIDCAGDRAEELVRVARHYPKMRAVLEKIVESSDISQLVVGHGAMVLAILVAVDRVKLGPTVATLLDKLGYGAVVQAKVQEASMNHAEAVAA